MRVHTFQSKNIKEGLELIKHELGPSAVIVSTRRVPGQDGREVLEIAAKGQNAYIAVGQRSKPKQGKVILHFLQTSPSWTLQGWGFIDPEGRYTKTILQNVRHGGELSWTLFDVPVPETN